MREVPRPQYIEPVTTSDARESCFAIDKPRANRTLHALRAFDNEIREFVVAFPNMTAEELMGDKKLEELLEIMSDITRYPHKHLAGSDVEKYITHDLNNIVTPLQGNAFCALDCMQTHDAEEMMASLEDFLGQWKRYQYTLQDVVNRMLVEQGVDDGLREDVTLRSAIEMIQDDIANNSNITVDISLQDLDVVLAQPICEGVLYNKLYNIVTNPIKKAKDIGAKHIHISSFSNGQNFLIIIQDDGKGMEADFMKTIFEEGVSRTEGGKGLGLAGADAQIAAMGGMLEVDSTFVGMDRAGSTTYDDGNVKYNTTFTITFPLLTQSLAQAV